MSSYSSSARAVSAVDRSRPSTDATDSGDDSLTPDEVFDLLQNQRRRYVLRYFTARDRSAVTLGDLAEYVAALEFETTVSDLTSTERKRVYVGLYQCHLPRMDDLAVVEFDDDRKTVTLGPNAPVLLSHLPEARTAEDDAAGLDLRYLAVSLCGTALFALSELGGANAGLTPRLVLVAVLGAVAATSLRPLLSAFG